MRIRLRSNIILVIKYKSLTLRIYYNIIIILIYLKILSYKKNLLINITIIS